MGEKYLQVNWEKFAQFGRQIRCFGENKTEREKSKLNGGEGGIRTPVTLLG
jgi:hypothetical protein